MITNLAISFFFFVLIFTFRSVLGSASSCLEIERTALLNLKSDLSMKLEASKLLSWKPRSDCCSWEGVSCHNITGRVVSLDLSGYKLSGSVNTTNLFRLSKLETLNLAFNDFYPSPFPSGFDLLSSLRLLNLSNSGFTGQIPWEISRLTKLASLDLSVDNFYSFKINNSSFKEVVRKLKNLEELRLDGIDFSWEGSSWCTALSTTLSKLRVLSLSRCQISGPICESIQQLGNLSELNLSRNNLSSMVPETILLLPNLHSLDLSRNRHLSGTFPEFPGYSKLEKLSVSYTAFTGKIPDSIGGCRQLTEFRIQGCNFSGLIPSSLATTKQLAYMDLSLNKFEGWIPFLIPLNVSGVTETNQTRFPTNLQHLDIRNNSMEATISPLLFTLPSLEVLLLSGNTLRGTLESFEGKFESALQVIDLSSNKLEGSIPESFFERANLTKLILHSNNFSSIASPHTFKRLEKLKVFDVSNNTRFMIPGSSNLSQPSLESLLLHSCNMTEIPRFLETQDSLIEFDLCDNKLQGEIPQWIWKQSLQHLNLGSNFFSKIDGTIPAQSLQSFEFLDLSYNNINGSIPNLPPSIKFLSLSKNNFVGEIPSSVCNMSNLYFLDICYNYLNGQLPRCLSDISNLTVITLRENNLEGSLEWNFKKNCSLRTLSLYGNEIKGKLPESLQNCKSLQVLDLGANQMTDTFPLWLQTLPRLQVLILHSNQFHGPIGDPAMPINFPMLHILDLSSNFFSGPLRLDYISRWTTTMANSTEPLEYMGGYNYREWVTITNKGLEMEDINILTIFTFLDLSSNQFHGQIPSMIGELNLLRLLNLSRNSLTGEIPASLSKLTMLETLDLSWNKLTGHIPTELTSLTFLAVLNLSYNNLAGKIPQGNQFSTFNNDSFLGNKQLCGLPLTGNCGALKKESSGKEEEGFGSSETYFRFDWSFAFYGYGSGAVVGAVLGYFFHGMLWIDDSVVSRILRRAAENRVRHINWSHRSC